MSRRRLFHSVLAVLALLAFLTDELGLIHSWFGYGVFVVVIVRVLLGFTPDVQFNFMRYYPSLRGLTLENFTIHPGVSKAAMLALLMSISLVTITGVMMDQGRTLSFNPTIELKREADEKHDQKSHHEDRSGESCLEETHELAGNLMMVLVGIHVAYLLIFKRELAKYMLYLKS